MGAAKGMGSAKGNKDGRTGPMDLDEAFGKGRYQGVVYERL